MFLSLTTESRGCPRRISSDPGWSWVQERPLFSPGWCPWPGQVYPHSPGWRPCYRIELQTKVHNHGKFGCWNKDHNQWAALRIYTDETLLNMTFAEAIRISHLLTYSRLKPVWHGVVNLCSKLYLASGPPGLRQGMWYMPSFLFTDEDELSRY